MPGIILTFTRRPASPVSQAATQSGMEAGGAARPAQKPTLPPLRFPDPDERPPFGQEPEKHAA